jgi:hypothetical protein
MGREEVSEEQLNETIRMNQIVYGSESDGIREALRRGGIFKKEGLTPCYVMDMDEGGIFVTSRENMDNTLN